MAVLDYEMSNLRSATKALELLGADVRVVREPGGVAGADAVVLPGVGPLRRGDAPHPRPRPRRGRPRRRRRAACRCSGICLGLQLLFEESEESPGAAGLGLLPGAGAAPAHRPQAAPHRMERVALGRRTRRWRPGPARRPTSTYYFVHTYACEPEDPSGWCWAAPTTAWTFCAAAGREGVLGVQFHPEKSSVAGLGPARPLARRGARPAVVSPS